MGDDFPILAAIDAAPAHSYQVLDHLNMIGVKATRSTLYRRVEALIAQGVIDSTEGERGRRTLTLTDAGQRMLADGTIATLRKEPLESPLFALAVSCARADHSGMLTTILRSRLTTASRRLTEEQRALAASAASDRYWSRAGRERRIAHLQADIAWLESVMGTRIVAPTETVAPSAPAMPQAG